MLIPWALTLSFNIFVFVLKETQKDPQVKPETVATEIPSLTNLTVTSWVGANLGHDLSNWVTVKGPLLPSPN